jgi:hypothetical protein
MTNRIERSPISQDEVLSFRNTNNNDGMMGQQFTPLFYTNYAPIDYANIKSECLLGENECSPLCSGYTKNKCNIVAPIPGPQWQVQSAATVQKRLTNQEYTMSNPPIDLPYPRKYY